jgi:hypothetical protein
MSDTIEVDMIARLLLLLNVFRKVGHHSLRHPFVFAGQQKGPWTLRTDVLVCVREMHESVGCGMSDVVCPLDAVCTLDMLCPLD